MRPTHNNYQQSAQKVKNNFTLCVQKLFTDELRGYKIINKVTSKSSSPLFVIANQSSPSADPLTTVRPIKPSSIISSNSCRLTSCCNNKSTQASPNNCRKSFSRKPIGLPLTSSSFPITVDWIENQVIAVRPRGLLCQCDFVLEERSVAVSDAAGDSLQEGNDKQSGSGNTKVCGDDEAVLGLVSFADA